MSSPRSETLRARLVAHSKSCAKSPGTTLEKILHSYLHSGFLLAHQLSTRDDDRFTGDMRG
jgi:hypothetical protein